MHRLLAFASRHRLIGWVVFVVALFALAAIASEVAAVAFGEAARGPAGLLVFASALGFLALEIVWARRNIAHLVSTEPDMACSNRSVSTTIAKSAAQFEARGFEGVGVWEMLPLVPHETFDPTCCCLSTLREPWSRS